VNRTAKIVLAGVGVLLVLVACSSAKKSDAGESIAAGRTNYVPKNDVEGHNYNARQAIADNPATLIWCTAFPTSPNAKAFTVPIVGKLTSGGKRPYPTSIVRDGYPYNPELAGPDGMYGVSGEYRYGFDPAGNYHDFYNLETYCTSVPNVVQREQTTIIVKTSSNLELVDSQVEAALKACRAKDPDPSKPCAEAARLIGAS
jgi:hypothetical protein